MLISDMFPVPPQDGEVGIEIEMEGQELIASGMGSHWTAASDGSLRGNGIEYVLRKPVARHKVGTVLTQLKDNLAKAGSILTPSDRCGVHVHLNMQTESFLSTMTMAVLYLTLEDLLVHYCGPSREGNLFCLRASDAEDTLIVLQDCLRKQSFKPIQTNAYRYASLNFTSLSKYGSLEFRALQTPKDIMKVGEWVEILLAVKDKSHEFSNPTSVVETLSSSGTEGFIKMIFGNLAPLIHHPRADYMLMDGIHRVQDLAYLPPVGPPIELKDMNEARQDGDAPPRSRAVNPSTASELYQLRRQEVANARRSMENVRRSLSMRPVQNMIRSGTRPAFDLTAKMADGTGGGILVRKSTKKKSTTRTARTAST